MNREQLIEEIKEYVGENPHETIVDYINNAKTDLKFFLWRLENNWSFYVSTDTFIHTTTGRVMDYDKLELMYRQDNKPHPIFQSIINNFFHY